MSINESPSLLQPIQRPWIMRALDYPGRSVLGPAAGAIRMACSLAGAIIAGFGALFTYLFSEKWHNRCVFAANYLLDEMGRGWAEVLGSSSEADKNRTEWESKGVIKSGIAFGNYIHQSPAPNGSMAYTVNALQNKRVSWDYLREGSETLGVYGVIEGSSFQEQSSLEMTSCAPKDFNKAGLWWDVENPPTSD